MLNITKALEIIGFILIAGTIYSYIGMIGNELRWPIFVFCSIGTVMIIIIRKIKKKASNGI